MHGGKTLILAVTSTFLLIAGAEAIAPHTAGNPYDGIMDRNLFGLKPPTALLPPPDLKQPPPDIKLSGITTILGKPRALLKAQIAARPPQPAKEEFYILTEGQRDGDIEVLTIDDKAGTVKVDNHGVIQTLDFANNGVKLPSSSLPPMAAAPGAAPIPPMNIPPPGAVRPGMRQIPTRPVRTTDPGSESASSGTPGGPNQGLNGTLNPNFGANANGSTPTRLEETPQFKTGLTGDQQMLLIEQKRAELLDAGNIEEANMYPHTDLTPQ